MIRERLTPEQVYSRDYQALQRDIQQKRESITARKAALLKELDDAMAGYRADLAALNKTFEAAKEQEQLLAEESAKAAEEAKSAAKTVQDDE